MKVHQLKFELAARGLNAKGLKGALVERLQEALEKKIPRDTKLPHLDSVITDSINPYCNQQPAMQTATGTEAMETEQVDNYFSLIMYTTNVYPSSTGRVWGKIYISYREIMC